MKYQNTKLNVKEIHYLFKEELQEIEYFLTIQKEFGTYLAAQIMKIHNYSIVETLNTLCGRIKK